MRVKSRFIKFEFENKSIKARGHERGVVLIAVMMFIAMILPITLLILDSVRIESLLPVNEAYTRTAGDEADKGFQEAISAIMADQDPYLVDPQADITDPADDYFVILDTDSTTGKHEFDYLAEPWARHPENDTIYIVERSLEGYNNADPDIHSVPSRWQLMNVPFGMDDFSEYYEDDPHPRLLLPFEYKGEDAIDKNIPAYYLDASVLSMLEVQPEGPSPSRYVADDLSTYWQLPPTDPNYYEDINSLNPVFQFAPRPASFFRNADGAGVDALSHTNAGLPGQESDIPNFNGFMQEDGTAIDTLVYDCLFDFNGDTNQYLEYMPLQQSCTDSTWANKYFGGTGSSTTLTAGFISSNREYKPAPGSLTRYQLGAQEEDAIPGWHETIVSDESGRFPINELLTIIYSSHNLDYRDLDEVEARRDQFDTDPDEVINNGDHPNHGGFLLARDILTSLLMSDGEIARLADSFDNTVYSYYQDKATWILRQMMVRRRQLDESSDFNRNGQHDDDDSSGEIFQFPERLGNNDSDTLDMAPPGITDLDGSGRLGDGQDLWDGTWRVYKDPKEMLTDFIGDATGDYLTNSEFELLNQRVTVYSMDTEHTADPQHVGVSRPPSRGLDVRLNVQHMWPDDDPNTQLEDEGALWDILDNVIGTARLQSIVNWREGLVDLNGDGDLDDEYVEQPVTATLSDGSAVGNASVSTITYRERNHQNFQDPQQAQQLIDPDYLNIKSLGDLITIPMSTSEGLIAYSEAANDTADPRLVLKTETGADPGSGAAGIDDRLYPDFSNVGAQITYDDGTDVYLNDLGLATTTEIDVESNRLHPSWGPGDAVMAYYNGDNIRMHDMTTDADSLVLPGANLAPDIADNTTDTDQFWTEFPVDSLIGNAIFEMGSPDINPGGTYTEIAFSQVDGASNGDTFLDPDVAYNIASVDYVTGIEDTLTENDIGTYDYAPDYSSNGEAIVFTRTTYDNFISMLLEILGVEPVPMTYLMVMDRTGTMALPLHAEWDIGFTGDGVDNMIDLNFGGWPNTLGITMHQPMYPNFSPDGRSVTFMDVKLEFDVDINTSTITNESANADVYRMSVGTDWASLFQPWSEMSRVSIDPTDYEIFPDWGVGSVRVARQNDTQIGSFPGIALPLPNAGTTDGPFGDPFTEDERNLIAQDLGDASLALRRSIGLGGDDQNWHFRDLPAVPEHMIDVLELIGDVVCFRDPYVMYDPNFQPGPPQIPPVLVQAPPLQAYPGRVNINTATRPVLRSLFLMLFQGPAENDPDDDDDNNGPQPRIDSGATFAIPIDLLDDGTSNQNRFLATMIADRYAHQVCEYRNWVYNNQGQLGVTDETVPSNLPLYEAEYAGFDDPPISHYGNFRANPFYPLVDTNNDGNAPDLDRLSPDPPFRSTANLFKIMLYDDDAFSEEWTYEGIGGAGGPDDNLLPRPMDADGNAAGSVNALDVFGPIYNAADERNCTHPVAPLGDETLYGFETRVDNDPTGTNYNNFMEQQYFRLFSADDFRRIAPWITVRTYNYRVESRGVLRVAAGSQRTDITRDKIWIITTNLDANYGSRLDPSWNGDASQDVLDASFMAQNRGTEPWFTLYFEETPQTGISLVRNNILPD